MKEEFRPRGCADCSYCQVRYVKKYEDNTFKCIAKLRLSGALAMTKTAWELRGGIYHGSIGTAAKSGWYTVRGCQLLSKPVTETEFNKCKDFAMFKDCYQEYCIAEGGKNVRPCLPVFFRGVKDK